MKQIELYVPLCHNDGRAVSNHRFAGFENLIRCTFHAFSTYLTDGRWVDENGRVYADTCRVYRFIIEGTRGELTTIKGLAKHVKRYWKQESVLYTESDVESVFV